MKKSNTNAVDPQSNRVDSETRHVVNSKRSKHEVNLPRNDFIYFQSGLVSAMLLVYLGLEYTMDKVPLTVGVDPGAIVEVFNYHEDTYNFKVEKVKQKTMVNPTDFKIVENDVPIPTNEEIMKNPVDNDPSDLDPSSIIVAPDPVEEDDIVPFVGLEDVPIFPGCENVAKSERRACFEEQMQKHVLRNFKYPEAAIDRGVQGKVHVGFTIGKDGHIADVKLKGPAKILENEAARIIGKLPQMVPGKQRLVPVKVSFSMPIVFRLD